jgi:hypothetical protein
VVGSTPAEFRAYLAHESSSYGALIKSLNLRLN